MKTTTRPLAPHRIPRRMIPRKMLQARAAASEVDFDDGDGESEPNMKLSHAFIVVLVLHVLAVGGVFAFNTLKTKQILPDRTAKAAAAGKTENAQEPQAAKDAQAASAKPAPAAEAPAATYTVVAGDTLKRIAIRHKTTVEALEKANEMSSTTTLRIGQVLRLPAAKPAPATAKAAGGPLPAAKTAQTKAPVANVPDPASAKVPTAKDTTAAKLPDSKTAKAADAKSAAPGDAKTAAAATDKGEKSYVVAQGDNPYTIAKKLKVSYNELLKANKIDDPKKLQIGQKLIVP